VLYVGYMHLTGLLGRYFLYFFFLLSPRQVCCCTFSNKPVSEIKLTSLLY